MRHRRALVIGLVGGAALLLTGGCCTPNLMGWMITPGGHFDAADVPPAPSYSDDNAWLALPGRTDEADVAIADLPAGNQETATVDVFYLHPTTSIEARYSIPADDPTVRTASIRGGTLIQASVFNACCAIYAPTYRQSTGSAYVTPSPDGDRAADVAYQDVVAAFDAFLTRRGGDRPFILAGHSQGAFLAARLLRERIETDERVAPWLVAAYIIGAPVAVADLGGLPPCSARDQAGCVVAYNARGDHYARNVLEFGGSLNESDRVCVNPTVGSTGSDVVSRMGHAGAVFFDSETPSLLPHFAASQCRGGRLVVTDLQPLPKRDAMSGILLWVLGGENHHPIEYQLFYADLRADAAARVDADRRARPLSAAPPTDATDVDEDKTP